MIMFLVSFLSNIDGLSSERVSSCTERGSDLFLVTASNLRRFCRLLIENELFHRLQPSVVGLSEVPGKGHWFDGVVDDAELQDFIQKYIETLRKPNLPKQFTIMTMNPGSTGSRGGLRILSLEVVFQIGRLRVELDYSEKGLWKVSTENVRRFRYQAVDGIVHKPTKILVDASTHPLKIPAAVYEEHEAHIDFCIDSVTDEEVFDKRLVVWTICTDSDSWGKEGSMERGPDTSGPSAQVLSGRKVVVVYPEGDAKLLDTAVTYANSLYIRGVSAQVTTDSDVSVGQMESSEDANIVLLGGPGMNRMAQKYYTDGFSADVTFKSQGFCLASLRCFLHAGTGIAFLSAGPRQTLLYYVAGTDRDGLEAALAYIPHGPASEVPEWIIVSKRRGFGFKGLGGVLGLGYWDHSWKLEVRKSYPAEFVYDVKRSGETCAGQQRVRWNPRTIGISFAVFIILLGMILMLRRKLRRSHHYQPVLNPQIGKEQNLQTNLREVSGS